MPVLLSQAMCYIQSAAEEALLSEQRIVQGLGFISMIVCSLESIQSFLVDSNNLNCQNKWALALVACKL